MLVLLKTMCCNHQKVIYRYLHLAASAVFFKAMKLPCRHVFSHRITHNMELFDKKICSARWTKNYYHESHRVISSDFVQNIGIPVQVSDIQRTSSRILSQHEKYRKAFGIAEKLASLASEIPMNEYHYALESLQKLVEMWEKAFLGKHVAVKIIDADQNAHIPPCQSQPPVTIDMPSTTSNIPLDAEHHGHTLQLPPLHSQPPVTSDMPPTTSHTPLTHLSPNQSQPSTKSKPLSDFNYEEGVLSTKIQLTPKMIKRGRPKASDLTVIGLPAKSTDKKKHCLHHS